MVEIMKHNYTIDRNVLPAILGRSHRARGIGLLSMIVLGLGCSPFAQRPAAPRNEAVQNENLAQIEPPQRDAYTTIYYKSGRLNIEAYLYKPLKGEAPFPLVIYNHGSRAGNERAEVPFRYVANVLAALDYLKTLSFVDYKRIAIMGWSHGGVATILTASRSHAFVALIDQAGG